MFLNYMSGCYLRDIYPTKLYVTGVKSQNFVSNVYVCVFIGITFCCLTVCNINFTGLSAPPSFYCTFDYCAFII